MSRYYDPQTHRFVNADGYFSTGWGILDTNMNIYCMNNPINYCDPTGCSRQSLLDKAMNMRLALLDGNKHSFNLKDVINIMKQAEKSYWEKTAETIGAFMYSPQVNVSIGYGIGAKMAATEYVDITALAKADVLEITLSNEGVGAGSHASVDLGVSVLGMDFSLWDYQVYDSIIDDSKNYSSEKGNVPDMFTLFDISGYFVIGASFNAQFNVDYFNKRLNEIFLGGGKYKCIKIS